MAGGDHPIAPATATQGAGPSKRVTPPEVLATHPEILIISPCGLDLPASLHEAKLLLKNKPWFTELLNNGTLKQIAIVDGNQMFNRPGPRLVDALEWLVALLWDLPHLIPKDFPWILWNPLNDLE
eukprot:jgi/Hompol1/6772/HPOL_000628-RA